jgi:hypothetical protein
LKKIITGAAVLLAISSVATAQTASQPNPPGTRPGWELGAQIAGYHYEEPDFVKIFGARTGIVGAYTFTGPGGLFSRIDARGSYGRLRYESNGTGTQDHIPDSILEARAVIGSDFRAGGRIALSPYFGLGYRYLYDDLRGYSSTGGVGYRRYSNYLYAPLGLTTRIRVGDWVLAPTVEGDLFIRGRQVSKLSDTGLGYMDATNRQDKGYGYRYSFMVEKDRWAFGGWTHYWHIKDSDVQPIGLGRAGREPENWTSESGIEVRYRF